MTFDEQMKNLAQSLELLAHVHADFERRTNISSAHNDTLDDHEHRIEDLES